MAEHLTRRVKDYSHVIPVCIMLKHQMLPILYKMAKAVTAAGLLDGITMINTLGSTCLIYKTGNQLLLIRRRIFGPNFPESNGRINKNQKPLWLTSKSYNKDTAVQKILIRDLKCYDVIEMMSVGKANLLIGCQR